MADPSMYPRTPREAARAEHRHAQVSAIVDRLTRTPLTHTDAPVLDWIDCVDAVIHEAARHEASYGLGSFETFVVNVAAEALCRLATRSAETTPPEETTP